MVLNFAGHWSIIRQGLDHLAIPRSWGWGGLVSTHCPVWAELYTSYTPDAHPSSDATIHENISTHPVEQPASPSSKIVDFFAAKPATVANGVGKTFALPLGS